MRFKPSPPSVIFHLRFNEKNENDMAALAFCDVFCSSRQPSLIIPAVENDAASCYSSPYIIHRNNHDLNRDVIFYFANQL